MSDETMGTTGTNWEPVGGSQGGAQDHAGERVGFCQNCGKPLDNTTIRKVGTAVYCEPCLAAKLAGSAPPAAGNAGATAGYPQFVAGPYKSAPIVPGEPSPAVAALLGMIPGVGAMYNEQYAKGIVHLAIFAVLMSLSHSVEIFGLFGFAWWCYMVFEAYHTARARRDGAALPDPFGLNDIGERLGFVRAATAPVVPPAPAASYAGPVTPLPAAEPVAAADVPTRASWGAPQDQYGYTAVPPIPPVPPIPSAQSYATGYGMGVGYQPVAAAPVPPAYPYAAVPPIPPAPVPGRFPAGAIWLIALGTLFLVGNTGMFHDVPESALVGIGIMTLAVWIFVRRMIALNALGGYDGGAAAGFRIVRAARGAVWVMLIGLIMLLNAFHWIEWGRVWPYFIILAGVMWALERAAGNAAASSMYQQAAFAAQPVAPVASAPEPQPHAPEPGPEEAGR